LENKDKERSKISYPDPDINNRRLRRAGHVNRRELDSTGRTAAENSSGRLPMGCSRYGGGIRCRRKCTEG
jgi:hypothetical protein